MLKLLTIFIAVGDDNLEFKFKMWGTTNKTDYFVDEKGLAGDRIDPENDLGLENTNDVYNIDVNIKLLHNSFFNISSIIGNYIGDKRLDKDITFAGRSFQKNWLTSTKISYHIFSATYEYNFFLKFSDSFKGIIGFEAGAMYENVYTRLNARDAPATFRSVEASRFPSYLTGIKLEFDTPWIQVGSYLRYSTFNNIKQIDYRFIDMGVESKLTIFRGIAVIAGYKKLKLDLIDRRGDRKMDFDSILTGPFIGVSFSF